MTRREWWTGPAVVPLVVLAAALPLLWPGIPPLTDLPSHMASYHVSVALDRSIALQRFFDFHWLLVGNIGVDLLVVPLSALFGVEFATKLIVLAIPASTALALLLIARQVHGRLPATALFAVPLAYNHPFLYGFVNYALAAALALLGLALWLRWPAARRPVLRAVVFAGIAAAVWLSHAIGWVMLCAMCGAAELTRRWTDREPWFRLTTGTAVTCLCLLVPVVLTLLGPRADESDTSGWLNWVMRAKEVVMLLRDRWIGWDVASVAVLILLAGAALLRWRGLRLAPMILLPAIALAALFVMGPLKINGSTYVNTRIAPYALMLAIVAIDTAALAPMRRAGLALAAGLFCALRLVGNTWSFALYDADYRRELAAVDAIPRGAAVLTLVEMGCRDWHRAWREHRLEHIPGMATVRRDAFVNVLWDIKGLHLLTSRMEQAGRFRSDPSEFVSSESCPQFPGVRQSIAEAPLAMFTHLWLINVPAASHPQDPRLVPVWNAGRSTLYRITGMAAPRPGA